MKVSYLAVGMPYFFMSPLEKALLASTTAALARGPKAGMPAASRASTIPMARGSSGATMTKSMALSRAQFTMPSTSVAFTGTHRATWAMPAFPGAQYSSVTLGLWASFQQMACSRPPPPTTRTFINTQPFYESGELRVKSGDITALFAWWPIICAVALRSLGEGSDTLPH